MSESILTGTASMFTMAVATAIGGLVATGTCFVVMGFGEKTDLETGRKLNLDRSYHNIIKPAVVELGLACERADEVVHSGVIDAPMYRRLLEADVVVADLSTMNPNALYELGVRHALRPYTTVVIAESGFKNPFDLNHVVVRQYEHLGVDVGFTEATRFKKVLQEALQAVLDRPIGDSPVYQFLPGLTPPTLPPTSPDRDMGAGRPNLSDILDQARAARDGDPPNWPEALDRFAQAHQLVPNDVYVHQQLVLATYKAGHLDAAKTLIAELRPEESNDPETLGIWGAIHKRDWDLRRQPDALDQAIRAYERGFQLRDEYYNAINLAYLLNQRAKISDPADAVTDYVTARRVRRQVITLCSNLLATGPSGDALYWVLATLAEAWLGVGDAEQSDQWFAQAEQAAHAAWMIESTRYQLDALRQLLEPSPLRLLSSQPPPPPASPTP